MISLLTYKVVISEHVELSAHGRPERGESAGKAHNPGEPQAPGAPQARRGFCSVLSQRSGRPCVEISHCEVEAALIREVAEIRP